MATNSKQHIVFMTLDEMMVHAVIANFLLENGGRLNALGDLEISDQFKLDLKSGLKKLDEKIAEVGK